MKSGLPALPQAYGIGLAGPGGSAGRRDAVLRARRFGRRFGTPKGEEIRRRFGAGDSGHPPEEKRFGTPTTRTEIRDTHSKREIRDTHRKRRDGDSGHPLEARFGTPTSEEIRRRRRDSGHPQREDGDSGRDPHGPRFGPERFERFGTPTSASTLTEGCQEEVSHLGAGHAWSGFGPPGTPAVGFRLIRSSPRGGF